MVLGARSPLEVTENIAHATAEIPAELWAELDALAGARP
ncbi:hypothetical protein [Streptomyces prunicolor]